MDMDSLDRLRSLLMASDEIAKNPKFKDEFSKVAFGVLALKDEQFEVLLASFSDGEPHGNWARNALDMRQRSRRS